MPGGAFTSRKLLLAKIVHNFKKRAWKYEIPLAFLEYMAIIIKNYDFVRSILREVDFVNGKYFVIFQVPVKVQLIERFIVGYAFNIF